MTELKKTALDHVHVGLGAKMVPFAGTPCRCNTPA